MFRPLKHFHIGWKSGLALLLAGAAIFAVIALKGTTNAMPPNPGAHMRIHDAADLTQERAESIYQGIRDSMRRQYAQSDDPIALRYQSWTRYNTHAYRSARHGDMFVNNYANDIAARYGAFEKSGVMPVGSILVKDGFVVTARGDVLTGPLVVMEKMPAGFNRATGDWRYIMIESDGSIAGITGGEGAQAMESCAACHASVGEGQDHLFFVPKPYRR